METESLAQIKHKIHLVTCHLSYVTHKTERNEKRKKYARQSWDERADNPKNKGTKI